jgi:hypothetical protein
MPGRTEESLKWFQSISENEKRLYFFLDRFLRNDDKTRNFLKRFVTECDNVVKIVALPGPKRSIVVQELRNINDGFAEFLSTDEKAILDSRFHLTLAEAAGNKEAVEHWKKQLQEKRGLPYRIWQSITRGTTAHYYKLREIHSQIVLAIEAGDKEKTLDAMQEHFAVVLLHYVRDIKKHIPRGKSIKNKTPPETLD